MNSDFVSKALALFSCLLLSCISSASAAQSTDQNANFKELARELKELRHSLAELRHNIKSLIAEYQRFDTKILEFGDFINQYIDDKPVPYQEQLYPYGFQNIGNTGTTTVPLKPRKQWVDHYRDNIAKLVTLSNQELQEMLSQIPAETAIDVSQECQSAADKMVKDAGPVAALTETSDQDTSKHLLSDLLDDLSHLELISKKLIKKHVTPKSPSSKDARTKESKSSGDNQRPAP